MRISICQLPENLSSYDPAWSSWVRHIKRERPTLAVMNEMPFGPWIARRKTFNPDAATASVHAHESALPALRVLPTTVIGSRPIHGRRMLCNEAFLIAGEVYRTLHHKHYFPQESGFFEQNWFVAERSGFDVIEYEGLRIGVLLCTELMFTEWARHYRRLGAHVIISPRASSTSIGHFDIAARMAAVVSGCYVFSSNRTSSSNSGAPHFGGRGFAYSPTGELIAETSETEPFACVSIDLVQVAIAQRRYPCNVRELYKGPSPSIPAT